MSATAPSAGTLPYMILDEVHENRWMEDLQQVVPGWTVRARWLATRTIIPVFVPDTADLPKTADTLIRHYGAQIDALRGG